MSNIQEPWVSSGLMRTRLSAGLQLVSVLNLHTPGEGGLQLWGTAQGFWKGPDMLPGLVVCSLRNLVGSIALLVSCMDITEEMLPELIMCLILWVSFTVLMLFYFFMYKCPLKIACRSNVRIEMGGFMCICSFWLKWGKGAGKWFSLLPRSWVCVGLPPGEALSTGKDWDVQVLAQGCPVWVQFPEPCSTEGNVQAREGSRAVSPSFPVSVHQGGQLEEKLSTCLTPA